MAYGATDPRKNKHARLFVAINELISIDFHVPQDRKPLESFSIAKSNR